VPLVDEQIGRTIALSRKLPLSGTLGVPSPSILTGKKPTLTQSGLGDPRSRGQQGNTVHFSGILRGVQYRRRENWIEHLPIHF